MVKLTSFDCFFITYDEPFKDGYYKLAKDLLPQLQRIDGVDGFDQAYKQAALRCTHHRFVTIDGDNLLTPEFLKCEISNDLAGSDYVLSWPAENMVNKLSYGHGGVKSWSKQSVLNMHTHEDSKDAKNAVDFCNSLTYYMIPQVLSQSNVAQSPFHAFRSGFREGVKLSLDRGHLRLDRENFLRWPKNNKERLRVWCSIGADTENGLWSIYGACMGASKTLLDDFDFRLIHSHAWVDEYWTQYIEPLIEPGENFCALSQLEWSNNQVQDWANKIIENLNDRFPLELKLLDADHSRFFKSFYKNPKREGLMFK